jgi:hypothetical protein
MLVAARRAWRAARGYERIERRPGRAGTLSDPRDYPEGFGALDADRSG